MGIVLVPDQPRPGSETRDRCLPDRSVPAATEDQSTLGDSCSADVPVAEPTGRGLDGRESGPTVREANGTVRKQNYGGRAAGLWVQIQSVYDHVLLSVCYQGTFRMQQGRIKLTHRFNAAGRVDFVELKFLRAFEPQLDGALRKLVLVEDFATRRPGWLESPAFVLRVLPRELILVEPEVFRYSRAEVVAWLINLGHWEVEETLAALQRARGNGQERRKTAAYPQAGQSRLHSGQRDLEQVLDDRVAVPILQAAMRLRARAESDAPTRAVIRYVLEGGG